MTTSSLRFSGVRAKTRPSLKGRCSVSAVLIPRSLLEEMVKSEVAKAIAQIAATQSTALSAARTRGASYARAEIAKPDNLTLAAAAKYSGRSDRMINEERKRGLYYALVLEGNSRGFRYPSWQFDANRSRLAAVFHAFGNGDTMNSWVIHAFLTTPNVHLDGHSPREVILDPRLDLEPVLALARARFDSDQGAG
ncbi:hypothetical protein HF313_02500 [Massilia atriviolacea]|uniref:Uncharacterized protein n=1 Tax=Massilia atriviolacea TaxID=2495579 RepID=A0A430HP09_9BURK|nr:hypothetical protein [Massilia atriviolacea]RSZ59287.1 hypothetical protein EJB06_08890 [Massilia atriviolacea]